MSDGTRFFNASRPVPNLRVVVLFYRFHEYAIWNGSILSVGDLDHAWKELDLAFANGYFTGLQKLYINVNMLPSLWCSDAGAGPFKSTECTQAHILDLFCGSRKCSLPIEVNVKIL